MQLVGEPAVVQTFHKARKLYSTPDNYPDFPWSQACNFGQRLPKMSLLATLNGCSLLNRLPYLYHGGVQGLQARSSCFREMCLQNVAFILRASPVAAPIPSEPSLVGLTARSALALHSYKPHTLLLLRAKLHSLLLQRQQGKVSPRNHFFKGNAYLK